MKIKSEKKKKRKFIDFLKDREKESVLSFFKTFSDFNFLFFNCQEGNEYFKNGKEYHAFH